MKLIAVRNTVEEPIQSAIHTKVRFFYFEVSPKFF